MSEATPALEKAVDIFSLAEVPVTLTYAGLGLAPITFYMRPFLYREEQEMRQAHFALTDEQREKAQHKHNVELLSRLTVREPEGLPMNGNGNKAFLMAKGPGDVLREMLEEDTPMKVKLVADALTRYYRVTQPAEFFRDL